MLELSIWNFVILVIILRIVQLVLGKDPKRKEEGLQIVVDAMTDNGIHFTIVNSSSGKTTIHMTKDSDTQEHSMYFSTTIEEIFDTLLMTEVKRGRTAEQPTPGQKGSDLCNAKST